MPRPIKYISYFDLQDSDVKRNYVTSASNKIEYIARTISKMGRCVNIISVSEVVEDRFKIYLPEEKRITDNITVKFPLSWGGNGVCSRKIKIVWQVIGLFFFLVFNCRKEETVIVYHSLGYFNAVRLAKRIRKFRLVLEVEEIYSDVSRMSKYKRNLEFRMFDIADAFILSTELLNEKINKEKKHSVAIYGTYRKEPKIVDKFDDGKIHVVYAGTFDPAKGGAQAAVSAAEFLPSNYHIHICGFGNPLDEENLKAMIENIRQSSTASISFEGLKTGPDFIAFLQRCHIGLSTQNPQGDFNDTSFPSKILTYLANGLAVVSVDIPVVRRSRVVEFVSFYQGILGKNIADAIINTDRIPIMVNRIEQLDRTFSDDIAKLLIQ